MITLLTEWGDFHSYRSHPIPRVGVLFLHVFTSSANTYQNDRTKFNRYTNMEIDSCIRQNMAKRSIPSCGIAVFHVGPSMVTRRNSGPGSWSGNASRGKLSMLSRWVVLAERCCFGTKIHKSFYIKGKYVQINIYIYIIYIYAYIYICIWHVLALEPFEVPDSLSHLSLGPQVSWCWHRGSSRRTKWDCGHELCSTE